MPFVLNLKSNQIVQSLQDIDRIKTEMQTKNTDIQVPLEVFEWVFVTFNCLKPEMYWIDCQLFLSYSYIDGGRNPQLFTKDCMEKALQKNEHVKGKIDSYRVWNHSSWVESINHLIDPCLQRFKAMLLVELSKVCPNEMGKYRAVRGDERSSN